MNELFVRFFLSELRNAGFNQAAYDKEQDRVTIFSKYPHLYVRCEDGEYIVYYSKDSQSLSYVVKSIIDATVTMTTEWERAKPMDIAEVANFRKLLDWNGIVLAARDDGKDGLHFVTWRYTYSRTGVGNGHYTTSFASAMQDFVKRSDLMPEGKIFDDEQLAVIHSALSYRLANDGGMKLETEQKIEEILSGLESIMEEKRYYDDMGQEATTEEYYRFKIKDISTRSLLFRGDPENHDRSYRLEINYSDADNEIIEGEQI